MDKKLISTLLLLATPTLVVVIAVLVLMNWKVPTRIQAELTVDRVVFTIGGSNSTLILSQVNFQSVTIGEFASLKLNPRELEVADPTQFSEEDGYPESAWRPLAVTSPVVIMSEDETLQPSVTVKDSGREPRVIGVLDSVRSNPRSKVTLKVRDSEAIGLTIEVAGQESSSVLILHEPFQLITRFGGITGVEDLPYPGDSLTYRGVLPDHSPEIEIEGYLNSLEWNLTIESGEVKDLFPRGGIPVTTLDFTRLGEGGGRVTSLVEDGEITYPKYPKKKVSIKSTDFIRLDLLEEFQLEKITLGSAGKGIHLRLNGEAGQIEVKSGAFKEDLRLTRFDTLLQDPRLIVLFSIVVWVFPTTLGAFRLYKELRGRDSK